MTPESQTPDITKQSGKDREVKQSWPVRITHFMVNFIAIGWVLNAFLSVRVYERAQKTFPDFFNKWTAWNKKAFTWGTGKLGMIPRRETTIPNVSHDLTEIVALGTGGFLVLPLQKLYASNRIHISRWVEKLFGVKEEGNKEVPEHTSNKEESTESWSHWIASRVVAFTVACGVYVGLKYMAPNKYAKMNAWISDKLKNVLPKKFTPGNKTTEYYVAEQIATVTGVSTLALTKAGLDKMFPPHRKETEPTKRDQILADGKKDFRERAETITGPVQASP